jgi:CRISPR-associated protein Cas1
LALHEEEAERAGSLEQLRGYEGIAAKAYFDAWRSVLDPQWGFGKRVRQPPTDPINAALSFGYTLLFYNVYSFIRARGLNVHVGFLHPLRAGHPALASDLMEEFRPLVVDALVFNLVLNGRLKPDDFTAPAAEGEACLLREAASKQFIHAFEGKIDSPVTHTPTGRHVDYRRCIDLQIQALCAVLRGSAKEYEPMVLR